METLKIPSVPPRPKTFPVTLPTTGVCSLLPENLQKRITLLVRFASNLPDAILFINPETSGTAGPSIVAANSAFEKAFGYTEAETRGKNLFFLCGAKSDPQGRAEILRAISDQRSCTSRLYEYYKHGGELDVELTVSPIFDEQRRCCSIAILHRLFTPCMEQDEEARLSSERFSQAFEYGPIGMALIAPDGRWLTINRKLCELIGYTAEELRHTTFQRITHPEDLLGEMELAARTLQGELTYYQIEKRDVH